MPGFSVPPSAIVNQIKSNLQDRYESGYPILKELLQNADDAKSRRFRIDACSGWPTADNPLLQGPGLLVANDGEFRKEDRDGILSYGESVKTADRATIGKFGLGQKAVFHLCDAFVIHAVGVDEPFSQVVNPFLDVDTPGNVTRDWECLSATDAAFLPKQAGHVFQERALILWLPFRREELQPAPGAGLSTLRPDTDKIVNDLARTDDIRVLLTALRHLESIEILCRGQVICSVHIAKGQERLRGPELHPCTRSFHGKIDTGSGRLSAFTGRETTTRDGRMEELQCSEHWPKTISTLRPEPTREKGDQHGAAMLVRATNEKDQTNELKITWAVFLPISENEDEVLPIDADVGKIHLLLHGYFFLDSGRRHIEGLRDPVVHDEPADEASLRRAWNTQLRDTVVLPLVPVLLKEALDRDLINATELVHLVRQIAQSDWFQRHHRGAICKGNALVRVLDGPDLPRSKRVAWRLVPTDATLRPLPAILASSSEHIDRLFERIDRWADAHDITLCIDRNICLTPRPLQWDEDEFDSLFATLSPQAFQSEPLAALLNHLLTEMPEDHRIRIARHMVAALRTAMLEVERRLAPSDHIKKLLRHIPASLFFALPQSVTDRRILGSLAKSNAALLPVRADLLETEDRSRPSETDLNKLLAALEPFITGDQNRLADQAQTAALALIAQHDIRDVAKLPDLSDIKILRTHDPLTRETVVLSFAELLTRHEQRSLFRRAPGVETSLRTLVDALPRFRPLIVYTEHGGIHAFTRSVNNKDGLHTIINDTTDFGSAAARARLIERLASLTDNDDGDRDAIAKLCGGDSRAHAHTATLWNAERMPDELERIITEILQHRPGEFLVPSACVYVLTQKKRQEIGIKDLDASVFERLIHEGIEVFRAIPTTEAERMAFWRIGLPGRTLLGLPIHDRSDDTVGAADGLYREDGWSVPDRLRPRVTTAILSDDPQVRSRQQRTIRAWSPTAQIDTVLSFPDAHRYHKELLEALSQSLDHNESLDPDLKKRLREVAWITVDGNPVALNDVLNLPPSVEEAATPYFRDSAGFVFARELPRSTRDLLERAGLISDHHCSIDTLAKMIEQAGLQARLGSMVDYPIEQFTELAKAGVDLKLPGWRLLAALLSSKCDVVQLQRVAACFHELSESESTVAGEHLDALATEAVNNPGHPNPAEAAYRHGFKAVAKWNLAARRKVFGNTLVPTQSGEWRSGKKVVAETQQLLPAQVLADNYANVFPRPEEHTPVGHPDIPNDDDQESRIEVLQRMSDAQHREYLEDWRGRVPADLIHVYLRIAGGGNPSLKRYASDWIPDSTLDIESEIAQICIEEHDSPVILIDKVEGATVEVTALSGDRFTASLCEGVSSLVVTKRSQRRMPTSDHTRRTNGVPRLTKVLVLKVLAPDRALADSSEHATKLFREFVETVASECLSDERIVGLLDRTAHVDQATLQDTELLVRERLPVLLEALKLPERSAALDALRRYQAMESRGGELDRPKKELWDAILMPAAAAEILEAVRRKIRDHGYGDERVLFELFQNADDAYVKREAPDGEPCFQVAFLDGGLRVVHWGRPINHLGTNRAEGRYRGYDRDLLNMLVMNFSEKRAEDGVTGKFGLGFKCVHLLSDNVGIASGYVSLRTVGGLLPEPWPEGPPQADALRHPALGTATMIDVPYTVGQTEKGHVWAEGFLAAMTWLPAFALRIKRIEVRGNKQDTVVCSVSNVTADKSIDLIAIKQSARSTQRALRLNLGKGYNMLLKLGHGGPECFEPTIPKLWSLAPLEESVRSAWVLNGPFPVDPGRGRLAGTIKDQRERFAAVGQALGDRLVELYDVVECDAETLVKNDALNATDAHTRHQFWCGLFDVMRRDLGDDLAQCLHDVDRGYGKLAARRPVVPTRLLWRFDTLVTASSVTRSADKALADTRILEATHEWLSWSTQDLKDHVVHAEVASDLRRLGFGPIRAMTLSELLLLEIDEDKRIDVTLATRLGQVITQKAIEDEPLRQERDEILATASQTSFRAQDGTWRPVSRLSTTHSVADETLLCGFAPEDALLHQEYRDASVEFFKVARMRSGYGPTVQRLREWIYAAHDEQRQRAALKYLVNGRRGSDLAQSLKDDHPTWIDDVRRQVESHPLLENWTLEDRMKLIVEIDPTQLQFASPAPYYVSPGTTDVSNVLEQCYEWWMKERDQERPRYAESVYPKDFDTSRLAIGSIDRTAWFTMLALACYQLLGRTQDEQHRSFIDSGWHEGWWMELAESEPPESVRPWLDRLNSWSSPERSEETYHIWERTLVDLYSIARGLNVYVELICKFPQFVRDQAPRSTDDVFRPSDSLLAQHLGLDAAPIDRAIGIGANWLMRELSRNGIYSASDAKLMAPYCWTPSKRVRATLQSWLDLAPVKDDSQTIFNFVIEHLGAERAHFDGDYDLPLQIVTQARHRDRLYRWFDDAGLDAPDFGDESADDETESRNRL